MSDDQLVPFETHYEVEQFLYKEARLLDAQLLRDWLETIVDPAIRYRMIVQEERFRKDRRPAASGELPLYDDNFDVLGMRIRQFESGLQTMLDPAQRLRRVITNISVFAREEAGTFRVLSYGIASRFRRLYENEQTVYGREDILKRDEQGALRLLSRRVDLDERVTRNKNLLFFL